MTKKSEKLEVYAYGVKLLQHIEGQKENAAFLLEDENGKELQPVFFDLSDFQNYLSYKVDSIYYSNYFYVLLQHAGSFTLLEMLQHYKDFLNSKFNTLWK